MKILVVEDNKIRTRAKSTTEFHLYPNQPVNSLDQSYKSAASTLLLIARRAATLFSDPEYTSKLDEVFEDFTHESLKNPLSCGEALRALTYPDNAFRVVKLPHAWLENPQFINFMPYFLNRFVLDYTTDNGDKWEICSRTECELTGEGLEEFIKTLRPPAEEEGQESE